MALTTRTIRNVTTSLLDYKNGVANAGPKWLDGVKNPRVDFRAGGIAAKAAWFAGVQAANQNDLYAKGLGKVTDAFYLNAVDTYGVNNYTAQTVAKADKWGTFYTGFQPFLASTIQHLDQTNPRGGYTQNKARLAAYLDALHAKKGSFKV